MTLPSLRSCFSAGFAAAFALAALSASAQPAPQRLSTAQVFADSHHDSYDPQNLHGFNHAPSVIQMPNGHLLAVWFSGPYEGAVDQVILHSTSADGGRTWAKATILAQRKHESQFDPALIRAGSRVWFFHSSGRWNQYPPVDHHSTGPVQVGAESFHLYGAYTDDSGATWSTPKIIYGTPAWNGRSNGIALKTGELVLPVHHLGSHGAGALVSTNQGQSWERSTSVTFPTPHEAEEPSIAQTASGQLLMVLRTHDGSLWFARSDDRGRTWGQAKRSALVGAESSANLLTLSDGRLLLTYDESAPPLRSPLVMRLSKDGGTTWGPAGEVALAPAKPDPSTWSTQASYPSVTEVGTGTVTALWASIVLGQAELYGSIQAAQVRVGE